MNVVVKEAKDMPLGALRMNHVVFDEISFERFGFRNNSKDVKTELQLSYGYDELSPSEYRVTLSAEAQRKDEYTVKICLSAYCTVNESERYKKKLIEENALAILFPYIRSEMTLLTSQPEVDPIVWPVMNINELLKEQNAQQTEEKS